MAFMKKLEKPKVEEIEKAREKFISEAEPVDSIKSIKKEWIKVLLRIRSDAVEQIDESIKERMGMTRTGWILEAIQEKLKRDE